MILAHKIKTLTVLSGLLAAAVLTVAYAATLGIGKPAPDFTAVDISGKMQSLSQYRGKIVVLDWADPECGYDNKHYKSGNIPGMQTQAKQQGIVWLTINSAGPGQQGDLGGAPLDQWLKSVAWDGNAYIRDPKGVIGHLYHATATPDLYVIDRQGLLVYAGAIDNIPSQDAADLSKATNYVKLALDDVIHGKPVATPATRPYGCTVKYAAPLG